MSRYTVTRACCTHGHCSLCVGGGNKANREKIVVRRTDDLAVAQQYRYTWIEYDARIIAHHEESSVSTPEEPSTELSCFPKQAPSIPSRGSQSARRC